MGSEEGKACRKIRECYSIFISEEIVETWRMENEITRNGKEEEVGIEPCEVDEVVCDNSEEDDFFYMYETVFRELHVRVPFTKFESEVLEKLNCSPVQMGPNAWAFIRAYEILCRAVGMKPSFGVFFSFHEAKIRDKGSWLYIGSQNKKGFLLPYASNYKSYNKKFFRVKSVSESCNLIANEEGKRLFPLSWQKNPVLVSGFKTKALTEEELADVTFLTKLKPVSCKKFIEKENDAEEIWDVISKYLCGRYSGHKVYYLTGCLFAGKMSTMTDAQVRAILKDKKAGKLKQELSADDKKGGNVTKSPTTGIIGRKRSGEELKQTTLNFSKKGAIKQEGKKKKEGSDDDDVVEVSELKGKGKWYSHMKAMEFEIIEMEAIHERREVELEDIKGKKKDLELKVKKCSGHEGEISKLKKSYKELEENLAKVVKEKEEAMLNEDTQRSIALSLQTEVDQKKKLIKELQVEVADRYDFGFEFALEQVKIVHPDIDLAEVSILKIIRDGKLVEPIEEDAGNVDNLMKEYEFTDPEGEAGKDGEGNHNIEGCGKE